MTELEFLEKAWTEFETKVYLLESQNGWKLFKTTTERMVNHSVFYEPPVYQVFDPEGKRKLAVTGYLTAYRYFEKHSGNGRKETE